MHPDHQLENVVLFDVPFRAEWLLECLQSDRLTWLYESEGQEFVAAALRPEPADLARLLRAVESWALSRGIATVAFELDGRSYTLRPEQIQAAAA